MPIAFSSSTDDSVWQFALAVNRSAKSLSVKTLSPWKLMLRDGLNLYAVSPVSISVIRVLHLFITCRLSG
jgi:hypothetical protein